MRRYRFKATTLAAISRVIINVSLLRALSRGSDITPLSLSLSLSSSARASFYSSYGGARREIAIIKQAARREGEAFASCSMHNLQPPWNSALHLDTRRKRANRSEKCRAALALTQGKRRIGTVHDLYAICTIGLAHEQPIDAPRYYP